MPRLFAACSAGDADVANTRCPSRGATTESSCDMWWCDMPESGCSWAEAVGACAAESATTYSAQSMDRRRDMGSPEVSGVFHSAHGRSIAPWLARERYD